MKIPILIALLITANLPYSAIATEQRSQSGAKLHLADASTDAGIPTPQIIQTQAKNVTVRVSSSDNGGSGVLIASKGSNYLVLTNKHVIGRSTKFQIKTVDGKQHTAQLVPNTQINPKYDLALLQFTSSQKYQLPKLKYDSSALTVERPIYSAGFPFDSNDIRFSQGAVSQLSDVPLDDGTQIGYVTNKGQKGIRQGMSGGPVFASDGTVIAINTIGAAPLLPSYKFIDGSKPNAKRTAQYAKANWGVPIHNLLSQLNPDILYQYANLPKVQRQVTPQGYMEKRNREARAQTVRIETDNGLGNGSGVIVAKEGNTYYVLTAKHVVLDKSEQLKPNIKTITSDQESYTIEPSNITLAAGLDLAIVKFTSNTPYSVAQLGDYRPKKDATVFAGGFPNRDRIDSPLWQWQFNPGLIFGQEDGKIGAQDKMTFDTDGYNLLYTSISYGGMSGGPVFDTEGRVIGIHGRAEGDGDKNLTLGNSAGISIQSFLGIAKKLNVNPQLLNSTKQLARELNPQESKSVLEVRDSIPEPQADSSGEQWLQRGNQLYRIKKYPEAVRAFDIAIAKGAEYKLFGNYGKALALIKDAKYADALMAVSTAIATPQAKADGKRYYYLWKYQSIILKNLRKFDEAMKAIDIAIKLEPTDPILRGEKASIFMSKSDSSKKGSQYYPQALAIFNDLIESKPEIHWYSKRCLTKHFLHDYKGALSDCNLAILGDPNYAVSYVVRAQVKSELGDKSGAILDFDRGIKLDPNGNFYTLRGKFKQESKNNSGALLDYNQAILLDPKNNIAYSLRGMLKSFEGDNKGALLDFDRVISLNPDSSDYWYRGVIKDDLGDKQGAIDDYTKGIKLDPTYAPNYSGRGSIYDEFKKYTEAIDDYTQAIKYSLINIPFYYLFRGNIKVKIGDYRGAILDYDKTIALDLKGITLGTYYRRGNAKYNSGDYRGAILDYDKAIEINPKDAYAYFDRGNTKSQLGDKRGAILDFDKMISLVPKADDTYISRGAVKFELGDTSGAIVDMEQAIAINPKNADGYVNRGFLKIIIGRDREALPDLERGIKLDSKQAYGYASRGFIREMSGDKQGAIADYKQAIRINPNLIKDWKKQAESVRKYNLAAAQKYQLMIGKLEVGSRGN